MDLYMKVINFFIGTTCIVLCLCCTSISFGPTDKTRREGEDNVIFICPTIDEYAPIWAVNGLNYGSSSLPPPFTAAFDNLLIPYVKLSMDQFTFRCFYRDTSDIRPRKGFLASATGTLTVATDLGSSTTKLNLVNNNSDKNLQSITSSTSNEPGTSELILHHRFLEFNEGITRTLSWHYSDGHNNDNCTFSDVFFRIRGWQCRNPNQINVNASWEQPIKTGITEITINSSNLSNNPPIIITLEAISDVNSQNKSCASLRYGIKISESAKTIAKKAGIGDDVLVPVPVGANHGIWPMIPTNTSARNDCECPFCNFNGENECYFKNCHCINRTSYMVSLQTVDTESSTNHFLRLHNITESILYIHFFSDILAKCIKFGIYREYFDSYWISVELPAQPTITFVGDNNICFNSESPTDSPTQFYELLIYDIAGEREYYQHIHSNCTLVMGILNNSICGPFQVESRAYNKNGYSSSSVQTVENATDMSYSFDISRNACKCIMSTVLIDTNYDVNMESINIEVTCNRTYSSLLMPLQNMSELAVNITLYSGSIRAENRQEIYNISCSEQKIAVTFDNLVKKSHYIYTIERRVESSNCILLKNNFIAPEKTTESDIPLIASLLILILVIVAVIIGAIIGILICVKRRGKTSSFSATVQ